MSTTKRHVDWTKSEKSASFFTKPSVYHALVIIFLEFFAFGLLTAPMISILDEAFPKKTFLMNGLVHGVKGLLSFLSAPLLGALSDVFGRKPFLLLTVTFTCCPIPLMNVSHLWYFALFSLSGIFSVTFSVVFAYVADITTEEDRSWTYGLVSATFAASLVTSPAIGAYLGRLYSYNFVIALSCAVALMDIFFILAFVPESLPEKSRLGSGWNARVTLEKADPFRSLKRIGSDPLILMLCIVTLLSFLPEAGEYSSFFVYLRLVIGFSEEAVALFIAVIGITSCLAQTVFLSSLIARVGPKHAIIVGLVFEMIQLALYGFVTQSWLLWTAGMIAGAGSITYPAISAFLSTHADKDQQGVTQGVLTGIRGLCNGLGPALFGCIFYIFQVDLSVKPDFELHPTVAPKANNTTTIGIISQLHNFHERIMPGPPFAFGSVLVFMGILVSILIPKNPHGSLSILTRTAHLWPQRQYSSDEGHPDVNHRVSPEGLQVTYHQTGTDFDYISDLVENSLRTSPNSASGNGTLGASSSSSAGPSTSPPRSSSGPAAAGNRFLHFWMRWRREQKRHRVKTEDHEEEDDDAKGSGHLESLGGATSVSQVHESELHRDVDMGGGRNVLSSALLGHQNRRPLESGAGGVSSSVRRPLLTAGSDGEEVSPSSDEETSSSRRSKSFFPQNSANSNTSSLPGRKSSRSLLSFKFSHSVTSRTGGAVSSSSKLASQ